MVARHNLIYVLSLSGGRFTVVFGDDELGVLNLSPERPRRRRRRLRLGCGAGAEGGFVVAPLSWGTAGSTATGTRGGTNAATFFVGELIKITLTVALLGATAWLYRDLNWLALIAGFVVALKSYIILLFRH